MNIPIELEQKHIDKFWNRVNKKSDDECWEWTSYGDKHGYGNMSIHNTKVKASRVSWVIHYGAIPDGLEMLHKCDNPKCVNPKHLFLGTQSDNIRDMLRKKRKIRKLSANEIIDIRNLYSTGIINEEEIGKLYNISTSYVSTIVNLHLWDDNQE